MRIIKRCVEEECPLGDNAAGGASAVSIDGGGGRRRGLGLGKDGGDGEEGCERIH